jgi:hypothetical protein
MKREFLTRPEESRPAPKRKPRGDQDRGAPAGLPQFLKGGATSASEHEHEANRVADEAISAEPAVAHPAAPQSADTAALPAADSGTALDSSVRERIEPVLGADLAHVRVHDAREDRALADALGARAFTHGNHIWLGPGESRPDLHLMAHEAAHVAQQATGAAPESVQKQPQPSAATMGTALQMAVFVNNPALETDASLKTALTMLNRYAPAVDIGRVDFRVMDASASYVGAGLFETGRSHWEGNTPVIELTQQQYDTIAAHFAGVAPINEVHDVVRTVGHEMFHLYREKSGKASNPIEPLFAAEAAKRMEQIRQNWIQFAQDPGGAKELGVPKGRAVTKWEDLPAAERKKIEAGATDTSVIQGLFERTSYLVEETYVRVEELSYLRVQQSAETGTKRPSMTSVSEIANLLYRLNTALDNSPGVADFMTPELVAKTKAAMLDFLRKRFPNRANPGRDSFEVVFYLASIQYGLAPVYDSTGALISAKPTGARLP